MKNIDKKHIPSYERGCKGKINLGHKSYKKNADRLAKKHGHKLGVYWCPWCGGYHTTKKVEGKGVYGGLVYITD